jgi:ribonucleoside-diphosphate reductase alpha chain
VKANLSGDFTVLNSYMVNDLKARGLWDDQMVDDLKYFDGSLQEVDRVPEDIKVLYKTAFEVAPEWLIECGSRRQKWIDMGQSLNLYIAAPSGKALDDMYKLAWVRGLKTTYYLRSLAATQIEKSTIDINKRGVQPRWMQSKSASSDVQVQRDEAPAPPPAGARMNPPGPTAVACDITDGSCEACQ